MSSRQILRLFLASPGDVQQECGIVSATVDELNTTWSHFLGLQIELLRWETHAFPEIGEYPQAVINSQIREYDIFMGLFWSRLGTPTPVAPSGTIEEFNRAYERFQQHLERISIMLYFKTAPAPRGSDSEGIKAVETFKQLLAKKGLLYWTFPDEFYFASKVRIHLSRQAQDWWRHFNNLDGQLATNQVSESLRSKNAERTEKQIDDSSMAVLPLLATFQGALETFEAKLHIENGRKARGSIPEHIKRAAIIRASDILSNLAITTQATAQQFRPLAESFLESITYGATLLVDGPATLQEWRTRVGNRLPSVVNSIQAACNTLQELRRTISSAMKFDRGFLRSGRRATDALLSLLVEFRYVQALIEETIQFYEIVE